MKIGIFGGSFNPPHKMHLAIALQLINQKYLDKIIYVPTGDKYTYKTNMVDDMHRYNMLKLITDKYPFLEVSNYELQEKMIHTDETINHFKKLFPQDEIYFICGADNLDYIDTWHNGLEILKTTKIIAVNRKGYDLTNLLKKYQNYNITVSDIEMCDISSTQIRANISKYQQELDPDVYNYIITNKLYKGE